MLVFQGSGNSGQPVTVLGETGANFTAPYWSSTSGAINTNGQSYITINGGSTCGWSAATQTVTPCNMTIVNTQNGTNLSYQASSVGISVPSNSSYVTVENVDIHNIYQKVGNGVEDQPNYTQQNCINLGYIGSGVTNITVTNVICHDVGWGIASGGPGPLTEGPGIEVYNADHDIDNAAGRSISSGITSMIGLSGIRRRTTSITTASIAMQEVRGQRILSTFTTISLMGIWASGNECIRILRRLWKLESLLHCQCDWGVHLQQRCRCGRNCCSLFRRRREQ